MPSLDEDEILPTPRKKLFQASTKLTKSDFVRTEEYAPSDDIFFARSKLDALLAHISQGEPEEIGDDYDSDGELSPPSKSQRRTRPEEVSTDE